MQLPSQQINPWEEAKAITLKSEKEVEFSKNDPFDTKNKHPIEEESEFESSLKVKS